MTDVTTHQMGGDARNPFGYGGNGVGRVTIVTNWATTNLVADDAAVVYKADKDCIVSNFVLSATDMDTHATPTLAIDVGITADDDEFIDASTVGQAGTTSVTNAVDESTVAGTVLVADGTIIISIETSAATAAAGTTTLSFDVVNVG